MKRPIVRRKDNSYHGADNSSHGASFYGDGFTRRGNDVEGHKINFPKFFQVMIFKTKKKLKATSNFQILLLVSLVFSYTSFVAVRSKTQNKENHRPRIMQFSGSRFPSLRTYHTKIIQISHSERVSQRYLLDSKDYEDNRHDPLEQGECAKQYEWQKSAFHNCNLLHEISIVFNDASIIGGGTWRDVWLYSSYDESKYVFKTLKYENDFSSRNYDRNKRDGIAMERLTSSPYILDIYGFCAQSSITSYGETDLYKLIYPHKSNRSIRGLEKIELLKIALHISRGIADVHNFPKEGVAAIAHTDISPGQFILVDGILKLQDFNRCRFIRWNKRLNRPCGYFIGNNPKKFRSPEEYAYVEQSEKVDVYSMGNIFYVLLTKQWPFDELSDRKARHAVRDGKRPSFPSEISNSSDLSDGTFIEAIKMCWIQDPTKRASARKIEIFLVNAIKDIERMIKNKKS